MCAAKAAVQTQKKQKEGKTLLGVKPLRPDLQHGTDRFFPQYCLLGNVRHEYGFSGEDSRRHAPQLGCCVKLKQKNNVNHSQTNFVYSWAHVTQSSIQSCVSQSGVNLCLWLTEPSRGRHFHTQSWYDHLCANPSTSALGVPISTCSFCLFSHG